MAGSPNPRLLLCLGLVTVLARVAQCELPPGYPSVGMRGVTGPVRMPLVGMGTWLYNDTVAEGAVGAALRLGYRHVDTACRDLR